MVGLQVRLVQCGVDVVAFVLEAGGTVEGFLLYSRLFRDSWRPTVVVNEAQREVCESIGNTEIFSMPVSLVGDTETSCVGNRESTLIVGVTARFSWVELLSSSSSSSKFGLDVKSS